MDNSTVSTIVIDKKPSQTTGSAPSADPVFFRTYSRRISEKRELWEDTCNRAVDGLVKVGRLTEAETELIRKSAIAKHSMPSGRWLWVGGTPWIDEPENFSGGYNCTSTAVVDWKAFGLMMDLAMMGCGTGAVLEDWAISQLPMILNYLEVEVIGLPGEAVDRPSGTVIKEVIEQRADGAETCTIQMRVGDSRQGWVAAYQEMMIIASDRRLQRFGAVRIEVNLSHIRPSGEPLKGFGGVANPDKLPQMWGRIAKILNGAIGRKLTAIECCLLIDEAAVVIVAGSIRRSAGMRQLSATDTQAATAKDNLWQQDEDGNWRIDPERDALRMANHTRVFHQKPTQEELRAAVRKQFHSGEGAIQYAPEAVARANADLWDAHPYSPTVFGSKQEFLELIQEPTAPELLQAKLPSETPQQIMHRLRRYGLNPLTLAA